VSGFYKKKIKEKFFAKLLENYITSNELKKFVELEQKLKKEKNQKKLEK